MIYTPQVEKRLGIKLLTEQMANAVLRMAVGREYPAACLVAFGGAGPAHACSLHED